MEGRGGATERDRLTEGERERNAERQGERRGGGYLRPVT